MLLLIVSVDIAAGSKDFQFHKEAIDIALNFL
jgi:hypothetical protein